MTGKWGNLFWMSSKELFKFDKNMAKGSSCHCEEGLSPDAAIQKKEFGLLRLKPRNDIIVIGTDEAGRGPGAGGVFASAVCFKSVDDELIEKLSCLNDSKKLSKKKREELYEIIIENTINSTVCIEVEEIEKINILNASLKAMKLACENVISEVKRKKEKVKSRLGLRISASAPCGEATQHVQASKMTFLRAVDNPRQLAQQNEADISVLVDGNKLIKNFVYPQQFIIKGDGKSASIAAASILAKVSRDRYMQELDKKFPQYNWKQNAGYLTAEHINAIEKCGITPHHRKSFLKNVKVKQLSLLNI